METFTQTDAKNVENVENVENAENVENVENVEKAAGNADVPGEIGLERLKKLKAKSHSLEPVVWIGKSGVTDGVLSEINKQLKDKGLIKVKLLRSAVEGRRKEISKEIAERTGSHLVLQTGYVAVLYRQVIRHGNACTPYKAPSKAANQAGQQKLFKHPKRNHDINAVYPKRYSRRR